ncbi:MAG: HAMP domain-containing histidine kinase [Thermoanaerobaculales bacterium]|nr:HAMP domain-containing histidine kinase [Thermoanaerobaculales bacterium]
MSPHRTLSEEDLREMVLRLAHEIRNPLATIQSAVQLLDHLQKPEGEVKDFYSSILTEVGRIDCVVRDMQRFVRLDSHTAAQLPVGDVAAAAVESLKSRWPSDGDRIRLRPGEDAYVLIDWMQVETAISELIENALRFSPPNSPVVVSWSKAEKRMVQVTVEDQGPGINEKLKDRILRPFFSTSTQGTGLGLNIAARVAELAGGRLEWENLHPQGTKFTLVLPVLAWV